MFTCDTHIYIFFLGWKELPQKILLPYDANIICDFIYLFGCLKFVSEHMYVCETQKYKIYSFVN